MSVQARGGYSRPMLIPTTSDSPFTSMMTNRTKSRSLLVCAFALAAAPFALAEHASGHPADAMFKSMDANSDGQISRAEHATGGKKMFTDADANRDGFVTVVEMDAAHKLMADKQAQTDKHAATDKPTAATPNRAEMFKMHDKNGDGKLTAAEHDAGCEAMFTKMDKNKDGSLTPAECMDGHATMKKA